MNYKFQERGEKVREDILQAIIGYIEKHGYPPSFREIGEMTGLKSTSSVQHHMEILFEEGKIETDARYKAQRAIRVPGYKFVKEETRNGSRKVCSSKLHR